MRSIVRALARGASVIAWAALLAACAASRKSGERVGSPEYGGAPSQQPQQAPAGYPMAVLPSTGSTASPPPPPPSQPGQPGTSPPSPAGGDALRQMQSAINEVERSQRELDVAAGDCRNACRALGSMDRAAGRLCGLTQGDPETRRCDDAKQRVYSARERVKTTCGQCQGGPSVERTAPIPSLR